MKRQNADVYKKRIAELVGRMKVRSFDAYYVVSDDFHSSEYVGEFFRCREYLSGFDGSAGEMIILQNGDAYLWTDGRYFLQAGEQLAGTGITLMKSREKDVPTIPEFLEKNLRDGSKLGFDGRTVGAGTVDEIVKTMGDKKIEIVCDIDLAGDTWEDRPAISANKAYLLDSKYTGETRAERLKRVREALDKKKCDANVISSLDDIAWIYLVRGSDVEYCPVVLSFTVITANSATLYVNNGVLDDDTKSALLTDGVSIKEYNEFYGDLSALNGKKVLLDKRKSSQRVIEALAKAQITDGPNPSEGFKAVKTKTEADNEKIAHIKDGVAVTRLIYYIKKELSGSEELKSGSVTELDIAERLLNLRKEQADFVYESFAPIVATGEHGAIIHYEPTVETNVPIENNTFLLMDTGGQYLQGTTDITRTVAVGTLNKRQKELYTAVLKGHLNLADALFRKGMTGAQLDVIARRPLWDLGVDYNHGTGHGVGYFLNVHEGPQNIGLSGRGGKLGAPFEEGMITSDEPGVYLPNEYGIRTENMILCVKKKENEYGEYLGFEMLTMVPYDRDAIIPEIMTDKEIELLNDYHKKVYDNISEYLNDKEKEWLREVTAPIVK